MSARTKTPALPHPGEPGAFPEQAVVEVLDVLGSIGDTCPDCPPDRQQDHVADGGRTPHAMLTIAEATRNEQQLSR